jgi:photosystem II stability/assembly factor-like uncharacterized protein
MADREAIARDDPRRSTRVLIRLSFWFPVLLFAEAATALVFVGAAVWVVLEQPESVTISPLAAYAVVLHLRTAWLLAFILPLLALAALLCWLGVRAAHNVRTHGSDQPRWNTPDVAAVVAQPLLLVAAVAGPGLYQGPMPWTVLLIAALLLGLLVIGLHRRRLRLSVRSGTAGVALAVMYAALPALAFGAAGAGGYPPTSNFAAGFTDQIAVPTGGSLPFSVVCPGPERCLVYAVSLAPVNALKRLGVLAVTSNGTTWRAEVLPTSVAGLPSNLACPTITRCYLGGTPSGISIGRTNNGGRTWVSLAATSVSGFGNLACPAVESCVEAGSGGIAVTHDGGASWAMRLRLPIDALVALNSVSCPSVGRCEVLVNESSTILVYTTSDGGDNWVRHTVATESVSQGFSIICLTSLDCLIGSNTISVSGAQFVALGWTTSNGGRTWTPRSDVRPVPQVCPSSHVCWTLGQSSTLSVMLRSENGGSSWKRVADLPGGFEGNTFACHTGDSCTVVGRVDLEKRLDSVIVSTTNGGRSWSETPMPLLQLEDRGQPRLLN